MYLRSDHGEAGCRKNGLELARMYLSAPRCSPSPRTYGLVTLLTGLLASPAAYGLPCKRDHCLLRERETLVSNPEPPGRIVVVDDDRTVADVVGRYLVRDGHTVECVHDGYEALRRVAEEPPDLVVLDLMLPGMDGLEVCRRLRARWPIPVVMLTALGDQTH